MGVIPQIKVIFKLKPQLADTTGSFPGTVQTKQSLYNSYGGMLLGYIFEVVKSTQVAEQYLVDVFNQLQFTDIQAISKPGINTFCQLQQIARKKLASFTSTVEDCAEENTKTAAPAIKGNKFVEQMAPEQQEVFCGVHYHGKSIPALAAELNKPEDAIRRILRESFLIIRNQRNDTATVHR